VREQYGDEITPEALNAMEYTEAVVKEALRWRSSVASVFRRALKTFQVGPYTIPKVLLAFSLSDC
jgi:cytochrome P450